MDAVTRFYRGGSRRFQFAGSPLPSTKKSWAQYGDSYA